MKLCIDRIEENFAVLEMNDKTTFNVPISALPSGAKEGTIVEFLICENEQSDIEKRIEDKMKRIFEN